MTDDPVVTPIPVETEAAAFEDARKAARSGAIGLVAKVTEQVGLEAGAKAVFGEPIEKNGRTVVPVAQMIIGAGAGSGESDEAGAGSGAGSGALTRPIGYIEIRDDATEFVPLRRPWLDGGLLVAASFSAFLAAKAIRVLLRG
jgi:hypothetical protein